MCSVEEGALIFKGDALRYVALNPFSFSMKQLKLLIFLALVCVACRALPSDFSLEPELISGELEFLPKGKLGSLEESEEGELLLVFYPSARYFSLDPQQSEEAARLALFLGEQRRLAYDYRQEIYVTVVDPTQSGSDLGGSNSPPKPLPCVVRVASTPDPRQAH